MRYVAIGDSFTEGVGDEAADGSTVGWADRVAAGLAFGRPGEVQYANLAVRGRLLGPIVADQLEAALALDPLPTLLTLNGGGNDMLRPRTDVDGLLALTERAVRRCGAAGVRLMLLSGADPSRRLPFGRAVRRRGELLTAGVAALARTYSLEFVDVFHDTEIQRPGYWSPDRLHLNSAGHRRVAALVLTALGESLVPADRPEEDGPARLRTERSASGTRIGTERSASGTRIGTELRYYREHVLPWAGRRLRGRSSGDGRTGKYPYWVTAPAA